MGGKQSILWEMCKWRIKSALYSRYYQPLYRVFSHDATADISAFQTNEKAAMFVFQTNPVGVELFSFVNAFSCFNKFA